MDSLLTLDQVAQILGVSPVTAKIWASKRKIPVVKVGRLVRIEPEALQKWIRENTLPATPSSIKTPPRGLKTPKIGSFERVLEELCSERAGQGRK